MREWIEMFAISSLVIFALFSLVWGSGLKSFLLQYGFYHLDVLPRMREWIEMLSFWITFSRSRFSLVWGSGLKWTSGRCRCPCFCRSPSYEGVDWNGPCQALGIAQNKVLPRMREWIEMGQYTLAKNAAAFSLVWGSGLKYLPRFLFLHLLRSPSYEGVDWNV